MLGFVPVEGENVWVYEFPRLKKAVVEKIVSLHRVLVLIENEKSPTEFSRFSLWPDTEEGRRDLRTIAEADISLIQYNLRKINY